MKKENSIKAAIPYEIFESSIFSLVDNSLIFLFSIHRLLFMLIYAFAMVEIK